MVSECKTNVKQVYLTATALYLVVKCQSDVFRFPSGSALDLNFSDINVASLDKELEEQDNSVGLASKDPQFVKAL